MSTEELGRFSLLHRSENPLDGPHLRQRQGQVGHVQNLQEGKEVENTYRTFTTLLPDVLSR